MKNIASPFSKNDFEIIQRDTLYQGFYRLSRFHIRHKKFNGEWSQPFQRELFEVHNAVGVLLYHPTIDHVVLIEQFRIGATHHTDHPWLLEIVSGLLLKNEIVESAAQRETNEETDLLD